MKTKTAGLRARLDVRVKPGETNHRATEPAAEINLVPSLLKLQSILVPVDFSWPSKKALQYAVPFAEQFGAKITLLFVAEPRVVPAELGFIPPAFQEDDFIHKSIERLNELAAQAMPERVLEKTLVGSGVPFQEITESARGLKSDLIILATHGHAGWKHALLGSTAERVVRHAPCPVLVVRENEREFV
jgi:nucleotide-binding universal stress UspA family protein